MQEVCDFLKKAGTYFIATTDGDQPRVRPFGSAALFDGKLHIQSQKGKDFARQVKANPKIEICAFVEGSWIRVQAHAVEDPRREARVKMLEAMKEAHPEMEMRFSADDENILLLVLNDGVATISSFAGAPKVIKF
jgi:uncharacterized pyridoxamine 5'-phosphate oxidase family protein